MRRKVLSFLLACLFSALAAPRLAGGATQPTASVEDAPRKGAAPASSIGLPLVAEAEKCPLVVVGQVVSRTRVDETAYAAQLRVELVLSGEDVDKELRVVWEEPASARKPRWKKDDWVVVALEEAPQSPSWKTRFPQDAPRWTIAAKGDAFLPDPDRRSVHLLGDYLAMPPMRRKREPGLRLLATMMEKGAPLLGESALKRLEQIHRFPEDAEMTKIVMNTALSQGRPKKMRREMLELAVHKNLTDVRAWLGMATLVSSDLKVDAIRALGQMDGALPPDLVKDLIENDDADLRAVAAQYARGELAARKVPELVRSDPAPQVRLAATANAITSGTEWGRAAALPALADESDQVRTIAIHGLAALGAPALAPLEAEVKRGGATASGAITALSLMGEPGRAALRDIAHNNSDEKLRKLALVGLGEGKDEPGE